METFVSSRNAEERQLPWPSGPATRSIYNSEPMVFKTSRKVLKRTLHETSVAFGQAALRLFGKLHCIDTAT